MRIVMRYKIVPYTENNLKLYIRPFSFPDTDISNAHDMACCAPTLLPNCYHLFHSPPIPFFGLSFFFNSLLNRKNHIYLIFLFKKTNHTSPPSWFLLLS